MKSKLEKRIKNLWFPFISLIKIHLRWLLRSTGKPHGLSAPLIVSLTSYSKRFESLHRTLKCLLTQTIKPDSVILWIGFNDQHLLTNKITRLKKYGLDIRFCEDILSYTKIIPALEMFPNSNIVTADDDVYYWSDWLKELISVHINFPSNVIAHRIHRIVLDKNGIPLPYASWRKITKEVEITPLNFGTGVGGVLYPHGCFHPDVIRKDIFLTLCPKADDIWLYWMVRLNGWKYIHSGTTRHESDWLETRKGGLWDTNKYENDRQLNALIEKYGFPL